jgi:hypothetical protein
VPWRSATTTPTAYEQNHRRNGRPRDVDYVRGWWGRPRSPPLEVLDRRARSDHALGAGPHPPSGDRVYVAMRLSVGHPGGMSTTRSGSRRTESLTPLEGSESACLPTTELRRTPSLRDGVGSQGSMTGPGVNRPAGVGVPLRRATQGLARADGIAHRRGELLCPALLCPAGLAQRGRPELAERAVLDLPNALGADAEPSCNVAQAFCLSVEAAARAQHEPFAVGEAA